MRLWQLQFVLVVVASAIVGGAFWLSKSAKRAAAASAGRQACEIASPKPSPSDDYCRRMGFLK